MANVISEEMLADIGLVLRDKFQPYAQSQCRAPRVRFFLLVMLLLHAQ
jgi:hypothetical protein